MIPVKLIFISNVDNQIGPGDGCFWNLEAFGVWGLGFKDGRKNKKEAMWLDLIHPSCKEILNTCWLIIGGWKEPLCMFVWIRGLHHKRILQRIGRFLFFTVRGPQGFYVTGKEVIEGYFWTVGVQINTGITSYMLDHAKFVFHALACNLTLII